MYQDVALRCTVQVVTAKDLVNDTAQLTAVSVTTIVVVIQCHRSLA